MNITIKMVINGFLREYPLKKRHSQTPEKFKELMRQFATFRLKAFNQRYARFPENAEIVPTMSNICDKAVLFNVVAANKAEKDAAMDATIAEIKAAIKAREEAAIAQKELHRQLLEEEDARLRRQMRKRPRIGTRCTHQEYRK